MTFSQPQSSYFFNIQNKRMENILKGRAVIAACGVDKLSCPSTYIT
jgi:hypothetical protein